MIPDTFPWQPRFCARHAQANTWCPKTFRKHRRLRSTHTDWRFAILAFRTKQTYSLPNLGLKGWLKKTMDERICGEMLVIGSSYEIPAPSIHSCKKSDGSCPKTKQMSWRKKRVKTTCPLRTLKTCWLVSMSSNRTKRSQKYSTNWWPLGSSQSMRPWWMASVQTATAATKISDTRRKSLLITKGNSASCRRRQHPHTIKSP